MNQLEYKKEEIYSFDIFDTLLFRRVKKPSDVFGILYDRNVQQLGHRFSRNGWIRFRREMEKKASDQKGEACIYDIYEEGKESIPSVEYMVEQEFSCECDVCVLNDEIAQRIQSIKSDGGTVVLTSDMYWPEGYIRRLLTCCGFDVSIDQILISCDWGKSKAEGGLFDILMKEWNVSAQKICHIGDHIISDYVNPKRKGICAELYDTVCMSGLRFPFLYMESDDANIQNSLPIRVMTGTRLLDKKDDWYIIGGMIYAPLIVGMLEFVIDEAEQEGIHQIFPFMREGEFFSEWLRELIKQRQLKIDVQEVYASRTALKRAITDDVIGDNAVQYFTKMGMDKPFISVDLGYAGTTGTLLDELLKKYGLNTKAIHCLGIQWGSSMKNMVKGHDLRGYLHTEKEREYREILGWILEMSLMSEKGKTENYDKGGIPQVRKIHYGGKQLGDARTCREGICAFMAEYIKQKSNRPDLRISPEESREIITRFFQYPIVKEVNAVSDVTYDEDFFDNFTWKVIEDDKVQQYKEKGFASFEFDEKKRKMEWIAGINTICYPSAAYENIFYNRFEYEIVECIRTVVSYLNSIGERMFYLVGLGFWGKEVLKALSVLDKMNRLLAIIDNEPMMAGIYVCEKRVISMNESLGHNCFDYLIGVQNKEDRSALKDQICKINPEAAIFALWG